MKKLLTILTFVIFALSSVSFVYAKDKRVPKREQGQKRYEEPVRDRRYRDHYRGQHKDHYRKNRKGGRHMDRRPHYRGSWDRYYHPGYRGHFRSRHEWNRYHNRHRHNYRDGRYYRDKNNFLMFGFCERDSGMCFSFSIEE